MGRGWIRFIGESLLARTETKSREELLKKLESAGIERDLRFIHMGLVFSDENGTQFNDGWMWLTGKASHSDSSALHLLSNPRDEPVALRATSGLLKFIATRYDIIAVFIDEVEHLQGESFAAISACERLRSFYEVLRNTQTASRVLVFLAATASARREISRTLVEEFMDGMDCEVVLRPMTPGACGQFVRDLFRYARCRGEDYMSPPFSSEDSLERFIDAMTTEEPSELDARGTGGIGTPRRVIKKGKESLQKACAKELDLIDSDDVENLLVGRNVEE